MTLGPVVRNLNPKTPQNDHRPLKMISLTRMNNLPEHLFAHPSKLELLEEIEINSLDFITDKMFTELC